MYSIDLLQPKLGRRDSSAAGFASGWERAEHSVARLATSARSALHGPGHWRSFALAGARICSALPAADVLTVLLFAITHDACRMSDDEDPEHGLRAADALDMLLGDLAADLPPWRRQLLAKACRDHADGLTSDDPTIGACWDADRLCLWRGDTTPAPSLMSTRPGMSHALIQWARHLHLGKVTWRDVAAAIPPDMRDGLRLGREGAGQGHDV